MNFPKDLSLVQDNNYLNTEGRFDATITKWSIVGTRNAGEEALKIFFQTKDGNISDMVTEKMDWKLKEIAEKINLSEEQIKNFVPDFLVGKEIEIQTVFVDINGKTYCQIAKYFEKPLITDDAPF